MRLFFCLMLLYGFGCELSASTGDLIADVAEPPAGIGRYSIGSAEDANTVPPGVEALNVARLRPEAFDVLKRFPRLKYLSLGSRFGQPALTVEAFKVIAELPKLTHLNACFVPSFEPAWLQALESSTSLQELNLSASIGRLGGDPEVSFDRLGSLIGKTGLVALDIEGSNFAGDPAAFLEAAKKLARLVCHVNTYDERDAGLAGQPLMSVVRLPLLHLGVRSYKWDESTLKALAQSSTLRSVTLDVWSGALPAAALAELKAVETLETFVLRANENLGSEHFKAIAGIKQLRRLEVTRPPTFNTTKGRYEPPHKTYAVTAEDWFHIAAMPNLETLRAKWAPTLTDEVLKRLGQSGTLRVLELSGNSVWTSAGIASLANAPRLEELHLDESGHLEESDIPKVFVALSKLQGLKTLSLAHITGVSAKDLAYLDNLTNLKEMHAVGCDWVDASTLSVVRNLNKVETLLLYDCPNLDDSAIATLDGHEKLSVLGLSGCTKVTNKSLAVFRTLAGLKVIDLRQTQVSGDELVVFWKETRKRQLEVMQYFKRPE